MECEIEQNFRFEQFVGINVAINKKKNSYTIIVSILSNVDSFYATIFTFVYLTLSLCIELLDSHVFTCNTVFRSQCLQNKHSSKCRNLFLLSLLPCYHRKKTIWPIQVNDFLCMNQFNSFLCELPQNWSTNYNYLVFLRKFSGSIKTARLGHDQIIFVKQFDRIAHLTYWFGCYYRTEANKIDS